MSDHTVLELRRYRLKHGSRDTLIDLFDREFVETQEAEGMGLPGQFRDLDDPDAFVWLRTFPDMEARARSLESFYTGTVWSTHGAAANATMVNSDNVLLLRPVGASELFPRLSPHRPRVGTGSQPKGLITCTVCSLAPDTETSFAAYFEAQARPLLERSGVRVDAACVTEKRPNSFRRLPVREGETVFVWLSGFADEEAYAASLDRLARCAEWVERIFPELDQRLWRPMETVRLRPTARSRYAH
jgi:quinol monooxygenase YgiN